MYVSCKPNSVKLLSILLLPALFSCSRQVYSESKQVSISGTASLAPVEGGIVTAYKVDSNGNRGAEITKAVTDSSGRYSLRLPSNSGAIEVVVKGGSYSEEASSAKVELGSQEMTALLPEVTQSKVASITPLTEIAAARARVLIQGGVAASGAISASLEQVAKAAGIKDILAEPADPRKPIKDSSSESAKYALLLAGMSLQASGSSANSLELAKSYAEDFKDGVFDGSRNGSAVPLKNTTIAANGWDHGLELARQNFISSPANQAGFNDQSRTILLRDPPLPIVVPSPSPATSPVASPAVIASPSPSPTPPEIASVTVTFPAPSTQNLYGRRGISWEWAPATSSTAIAQYKLEFFRGGGCQGTPYFVMNLPSAGLGRQPENPVESLKVTPMDSSGNLGIPGCSPTVNVVDVAAADKHSCRLIGGIVQCWGANASGELGNGTGLPSTTPVTVAGISNAMMITARGHHTCALLSDKTVKCWGTGGYGVIGDGSTTNRLTPVLVPGLTNVQSVVAGIYHTCAIMMDASVKCWGQNTFGQLGDGSINDSLVPKLVPGVLASSISLGINHTCAQTTSNTVMCWGRNTSGQIGNGNNIDQYSPVTVPGLTGVNLVSAGGYFTCANVFSPTSIKCWGENAYGQLGDGTFSGKTSPSLINTEMLFDIRVGLFHSCYATNVMGSSNFAGKQVKCHGKNTNGQVNDGTTVNRALPFAIPSIPDAVALDSGWEHSCAIRANGSTVCWGMNDQGQIYSGP